MVENDLEIQDPKPKSNRLLWPVSLIVVVLIVAGAGVYARNFLRNSCEVNAVEEASVILSSQVKMYDDVYQSATAASQTSVVVPLSVMQQILMDTQDVDVPGCMQTAKEELINYMGTVIDALLAYSEEDANTTIRDLINQSEIHFANFRMELREVKACAPLCIRW